MRRQIKRYKSVLFGILGIWIVCVGIQRFAVPFIFDHVLEPYQVKRIYDTLGKDYIPKDAAAAADIAKNTETKKDDGDYNVKQSKIAIGSGGLTGKGLLKGTQTRYSFVPEQRTDFIFCTIGEVLALWKHDLPFYLHSVAICIATIWKDSEVLSADAMRTALLLYCFSILPLICV